MGSCLKKPENNPVGNSEDGEKDKQEDGEVAPSNELPAATQEVRNCTDTDANKEKPNVENAQANTNGPNNSTMLRGCGGVSRFSVVERPQGVAPVSLGRFSSARGHNTPASPVAANKFAVAQAYQYTCPSTYTFRLYSNSCEPHVTDSCMTMMQILSVPSYCASYSSYAPVQQQSRCNYYDQRMYQPTRTMTPSTGPLAPAVYTIDTVGSVNQAVGPMTSNPSIQTPFTATNESTSNIV